MRGRAFGWRGVALVLPSDVKKRKKNKSNVLLSLVLVCHRWDREWLSWLGMPAPTKTHGCGFWAGKLLVGLLATTVLMVVMEAIWQRLHPPKHMCVVSRQVNLSWVIVGKDSFDGGDGGDMVTPVPAKTHGSGFQAGKPLVGDCWQRWF